MDKIKEIVKKDITHIYDEELGYIQTEFIYDTECELYPEDNHGDSTIEVFKDNTLIWENSN